MSNPNPNVRVTDCDECGGEFEPYNSDGCDFMINAGRYFVSCGADICDRDECHENHDHGHESNLDPRRNNVYQY